MNPIAQATQTMPLCKKTRMAHSDDLGLKERPIIFRKHFSEKGATRTSIVAWVSLTSKPILPKSQLTTKPIPRLRRSHRPDSHRTPSPHPPDSHIERHPPVSVEERGSKTSIGSRLDCSRKEAALLAVHKTSGTRIVNTDNGRSKNAGIDLLHKKMGRKEEKIIIGNRYDKKICRSLLREFRRCGSYSLAGYVSYL